MGGELILSGITTEQLTELLGDLIAQKVEEAVKKAKTEELMEKFLSGAEVQKLFVPRISRGTLSNWTKDGILKSYTIGRSVFYRYAEVIEAAKNLKRYKNKS